MELKKKALDYWNHRARWESYLAEFLLKKGYEVHGIVRRSSSFNTERIEHLSKEKRFFEDSEGIVLHYGDLTDSSSLKK